MRENKTAMEKDGSSLGMFELSSLEINYSDSAVLFKHKLTGVELRSVGIGTLNGYSTAVQHLLDFHGLQQQPGPDLLDARLTKYLQHLFKEGFESYHAKNAVFGTLFFSQAARSSTVCPCASSA